MFPMQFDRQILEGLPLPDSDAIKRTHHILQAVLARRVLPYFKNKRGTDSIQLARAGETMTSVRLEDPEANIDVISLIRRSGSDQSETEVLVHERIFDFLAFVIPSDPQARLDEGSRDEQKMLAFIEFVLRHQTEHVLYPNHTELQVIESDVAFAQWRFENDPTYYRMLGEALSDEMMGLRGAPYLRLLDLAEKDQALDSQLDAVLRPFIGILCDLPGQMLRDVFPALNFELGMQVLGECYWRSRDNTNPLILRTAFLAKILQLFAHLVDTDSELAKKTFSSFKEQWGVVALFHELGLRERDLTNKGLDQVFEHFRRELTAFFKRSSKLIPSSIADKEAARLPAQPPVEERKQSKSLKDRIQEAHEDPLFPRQVLEVIDKNKLNAVGHSGSKYSELIETLLAVPWGKQQPIMVSPQQFEEGLNRTHYGLQRPKEIVSDFFTNLIWRYRKGITTTEEKRARTGSAFLFVGPPGVGKTSLAISIAGSLGIPYHKLSLGGMKDEADLRGHGFTYEGSKPGAIVQGLIKMSIMNGMFIMDEADKTEKFAIATLLEILDPEQNHLFHDKYTQTTVDIDLSNCHFILTANTLETVPPPVINRCEVVVLDRYSVDEKVAIARRHLIQRVRTSHQISEREIRFDRSQEADLIKHLIKTYTREAGVRELERVIRTLFLRLLRKELLNGAPAPITINREKIKQVLEPPSLPRQINPDDRIGEMSALGVDLERGIGSIIPIQATRIEMGLDEPAGRSFLSMVHATGNIEKIMDESRKVATTAILHNAGALHIDAKHIGTPIHLHFMGGSSRKDGPSAGGAIALALASTLSRQPVRRDVAMTGEIDTQGRILSVGGLDIKIDTAYDAGCRTTIIPAENLMGEDGIERLPGALKEELQILSYDQWRQGSSRFNYTKHILQIVAVEHIIQAAHIAFISETELAAVRDSLSTDAMETNRQLDRSKAERPPCVFVLYAKDPREVDLAILPSNPDRGDSVFCLIHPDGRAARPEACSHLEKLFPVFDFEPGRERLEEVFEQIAERVRAQGVKSCRLGLSAPFFFLKHHGISPQRMKLPAPFEKLLIFANNFTHQGVKIKSCKATLNRVYRCLTELDPGLIEAHPFLAKDQGIFLIDLDFIPEKLRLDISRAEQLLNDSLANWLALSMRADVRQC